MKVYCDNKGAPKNAFRPIKAGITPYLAADHDLIEVSRFLIQLIPVVIATEWVKGHYRGKDREYKHRLNDTADRLAGDFQGRQHPHRTIRKPIAPLDFKVCLLHDSSVMTSKAYQCIVTNIHDPPLAEHIQRKAKWTQAIFGEIIEIVMREHSEGFLGTVSTH
jgi:hypothetical protein